MSHADSEGMLDASIATPRKQWLVIAQFLRYCMVGGLAFLVDFLILTALTEVTRTHYLLSVTAGFLAGLAVNYLLSVYWVFSFRRLQDRRAEFFLFGVVGLAGLLLTYLSMITLTEYAHLDYRVAKILTAAVVLVFNFSGRRWLLFTRN